MQTPGLVIGKNYGISTITEEVIHNLKASGILEIGIGWELLLSQNGDKNPDANIVMEKLRRNEINVVSVEAPEGRYGELFQPTEKAAAELKKYKQLIVSLLQVAGQYQLNHLVISSAGACRPGSTQEELHEFCRFLLSLVGEAEKSNVILAVKNSYYPQESKNDSTEKLVRVMKNTASAYIRICQDVGHSNIKGRKGAVLEDFYLLYPYLVQLYLNDNDHEGDLHLQPGYGNAPWDGLGKLIASKCPQAKLLINSQFHQQAAVNTVLAETCALLKGNVYTRPDGGIIGKGPDGRIIIREN